MMMVEVQKSPATQPEALSGADQFQSVEVRIQRTHNMDLQRSARHVLDK